MNTLNSASDERSVRPSPVPLWTNKEEVLALGNNYLRPESLFVELKAYSPQSADSIDDQILMALISENYTLPEVEVESRGPYFFYERHFLSRQCYRETEPEATVIAGPSSLRMGDEEDIVDDTMQFESGEGTTAEASSTRDDDVELWRRQFAYLVAIPDAKAQSKKKARLIWNGDQKPFEKIESFTHAYWNDQGGPHEGSSNSFNNHRWAVIDSTPSASLKFDKGDVVDGVTAFLLTRVPEPYDDSAELEYDPLDVPENRCV